MSANDIKKLVDEKEAKFIDYRFTNTQGKEQHVTVTCCSFPWVFVNL